MSLKVKRYDKVAGKNRWLKEKKKEHLTNRITHRKIT